MSFRGLPTERDCWSRFCDRHRASIEVLGCIAIAFSGVDRFEELLQSGLTSSKDATAELGALSEEEWRVFEEFVGQFRNDWQTYFVATLYPSYFREVERRRTTNSSTR